MSFDDSTGGIDRLNYRNQAGLWGDDWGDRKPRSMLDACRIAAERAVVDAIADRRLTSRRARLAADATRSRAKPIEAAIRREMGDRSRTAMGVAMHKAFEREGRADARERAIQNPTM